MAKTKVVSYSELDTFRQCPFKHQLAYIERWGGGAESEALSRGTLWHLVMETHYRAIQKAQRGNGTVDEVTLYSAVSELLYDRETGNQNERQELVEWMYRGYVEQFGLDDQWKIVDIEKSFEAWLPTERGTRSSFKMAGTIDLLVRDMSAGGGLWIVDHKTCRDLPKQKDFDMEDQTAIYAYLLRRAGVNIRGAIYNHCRTYRLVREMTLDERFKRTLTVRSDKELETMALEALDAFREAYKPRPEGAHARRHPDGERCGWKCGFTEPCLASRKGADHRLMMSEFGFEVQDHRPGPTFERLYAERGIV